MPRVTRIGWLGPSFALLLAVVLLAMALLSRLAFNLDAAEASARQQAALDERVRLALWRMDSALAPRLAWENARPVTSGRAASSATASLEPTAEPWGAVPADLAVSGRYLIPLRSPHPTATAAAKGRPIDEIPQWLLDRIDPEAIAQRLPKAPWDAAGQVSSPRGAQSTAQSGFPAARDRQGVGENNATVEFAQRGQSLATNNAMVQQINAGNLNAGHGAESNSGGERPLPPMTPLWLENRLALVRKIDSDAENIAENPLAEIRSPATLQVCVLDRLRIERWLLELVSDLLPDASFQPVRAPDLKGAPDRLAALPFRLVPGDLPALDQAERSSLMWTLSLAWAGVLLATAATACLLLGVVRLAERRAAFVRAVTHELRTPLTTFQLYTELLSGDGIVDGETRQQYLRTLRSEAIRLSHLVENVLAFARLERGRRPGKAQQLTAREMLDRILPRLESMAAAAGMQVQLDDSPALEVPLWANVGAVEQILINLVDNACKYAADADPPRIDVTVMERGRRVELRVRDYGPGLPRGLNWMHPFSKTAEQAAETAPGIGLGLVLSRRLAADTGARLTADRSVHPGACLVLKLPRAPAPV